MPLRSSISLLRLTAAVCLLNVTIAGHALAIDPFWGELGPGPDLVPRRAWREQSGAVEAIALHPSRPETVYIAAASGGIWRTENALDPDPIWEPVLGLPWLARLPTLATSAIVFSPLDPTDRTLYVGTGYTSSGGTLAKWFDGRIAGLRRGIFRTTDAGASWEELGRSIFQTADVQKIVPTGIGTASREVLLVAANNGVWRSPDGGLTWIRVLGGFANDLVQSHPGSQVLVAAMGGTVWRSRNEGVDWRAIGPPNASCTALTVSPIPLLLGGPPPAGRFVFPLYAGCRPSVFRSLSDGDDWTPLPPFPDGGGYDRVLCVSPESPLAVIAQASKFADNGDTHYWGYSPDQSDWMQLDGSAAANTGPHVDARMCVFGSDPALMFESDDGGVYRLRDPLAASRRWDPAVGNLRVTEFLDVAYDNVNDVAFGAAWDISIPQQRFPQSLEWENEEVWGDGMTVGVDNAGTTAFHYSSQQKWFHNHRRQRTGNTIVRDEAVDPKIEGIRWNQFEGEIDDRANDEAEGFSLRFYTTWVVNNADGKRILLGTDYLFESSDRGDNYVALGGTTTHPRTGSKIPAFPIGLTSAMAYGHPENHDVLYVGTTGNARVPRPGATPGIENRMTEDFWVRTTGTGDPEARATYSGNLPLDIAISPSDWRRAYVLDSRGRVWRTPDAGVTWVDITGDPTRGHALSNLTFDARTIDAASLDGVDTLLVGGFGGVFVAHATAFTPSPIWSSYSANLPPITVTDIHYDAVDDLIVIGTWGRGAWKLEAARATLAAAPPPGVRLEIGKPSCEPIVTRSTEFALTGVGDDVTDVAYAVFAEGSTPAYTVVPGASARFTIPPATPVGSYFVSGVATTTRGATAIRTHFVQLVEEADLLEKCANQARLGALIAFLRHLARPPSPLPPPPHASLFVPLINHVEGAARFVQRAEILARTGSSTAVARQLDGAIDSMLRFDRKLSSQPYDALPTADRTALAAMAEPVTQDLQTLNVDCRICASIPAPSCGDGRCGVPDEACYNCEVDCGTCEEPCVCDEETRARCADGSLSGLCCKMCSCGDGTCDEEEDCEVCPQDCGACGPPPPACGDTAPACNGTCPSGHSCELDAIDLPPRCLCVSDTPPCGGSFPECNGSCPPGEGCFNQGSSCTCAVPIP
jgi:photosystem II stability/assembly factor-like uncharacterized protein